MLGQLLSTGGRHQTMPECYIRPEEDRPRLREVVCDDNIPIVDISCFDKTQVIQEIGLACAKYGFFQVVNHGFDMELIDKMKGVGKEFFQLSPEEKMKLYSDDPAKKMRLSTSFNVRKETVNNWRDYLRLHCYPLQEYVPDWPSNPSAFK